MSFKMKSDIQNMNILFEKSLGEIENKMKELFINNIKIKENIKSINHYENKNISLDKEIKDKKAELNILKKLLILKEKKKLNFELIISKYFSNPILPNHQNNEIDNNFVNKKRINSIVEGFNNEFNYYLNINKKKSKKKLYRYNSDLFNKELIKKNNEDFINNEKTNHIHKNIIITKENKIRNISEKNSKNNYNKINYEGNKNLKKSRDNLENYFLQHLKEKNPKIDYFSFIRLLFLKINLYKNRINKHFFSILIKIYTFNKLKNVLSFITVKKLVISQIKTIMINAREIYNENKNEEIITDDEFLNNINSNEYDEGKSKNIIKELTDDLEKMKKVNSEINSINIRIVDFIEKFNEFK